MVEKEVPYEAETKENLSFPEIPIELLLEDEEIYRRLNIPWLPNEMQSTAGNKAFDLEKENLQRTIKQYKHQVEYMQETNDGLVMANRRLREDLDEVNSHYQELIAVSKEALKRKRNTKSQFTILKQTIKERDNNKMKTSLEKWKRWK